MTAWADESGKCGDNLTWTYVDATKTLTISGTGTMWDYDTGDTPWYYSYRSTIQTIFIQEGVTHIGGRAFQNCFSLTSINIPNSVTSIASRAFEGCGNLTSVHITDLAAWCNITFDSGLYANPLCYAHHLYLNNQEITNLIIPEGMTSIGDFAFQNCTGLTSITIPNSVTDIGHNAFEGCRSLTSITIPNSVTSIGNYAFYKCI